MRVGSRGDARTVAGMKPRRVLSSLVVVAAAAALVAGCGGSGTAKAPTPIGGSSSSSGGSSSSSNAESSSGSGIKIDNFAFSPATLTVSGDGAIAVANDDSTAHTFTADDGHSFDTGPIDTGASTSVTAPRPGRYPYHCTIHPFMHGTLVVR
jgi:plastocyanin